MDQLPVLDALPELRTALRERGAAVLQAPPGAGKTTLVPLALLDEPWLGGQRLLILEPRRLAARAAARRMAALLGEEVGGTVGYRMRGDTQVGPGTRVEVLTEGVLTRLLQQDPTLAGVGLVIFDEYHERSLHADLGLALTLQTRTLLRPELRLLVMSATLAADPVARLLGQAPFVRTEGRSWPVELHYLDRPVAGSPVAAATRFAMRALERHQGDILVFLPGAAELRRAHDLLRAAHEATDVYPLHGSLPPADQDRALRPSPPGRRKVVLATGIAETSLTIEGVSVVVDAGLMRVPRFSARTGMTRLETVRVTRAAADQRAGRAGRLGPGVCYRLWTPGEHAALLAHGSPEILESDLTALALELALRGVSDPNTLAWLDPPPAGSFAQARELLSELGALDVAGAVTEHGRELSAFPTHPRLAQLLLHARRAGLNRLGAELAALLENRDPLRFPDGRPDPDIRLRLQAMRSGRSPADRTTIQHLRREVSRWVRRLGRHATPPGTRPVQPRPAPDRDRAPGPDHAGLLLALGYPDRIAQRRSGSPDRLLLRNGRGARLPDAGALSTAEFLVVAELDDRGTEARVFLAAPVERAVVEEQFRDQILTERVVEFDENVGGVRAREIRRLGALVLQESQLGDVAPDAILAVLLAALRRRGLEDLDWSGAARQLRERIAFLHCLEPGDWPDVSDDALLATLDQWLAPFAAGARRLADLHRIDLGRALLAQLDWTHQQALDRLAPSHWQVPSGSRIRIDYQDPTAPVLAVRLQEMFGTRDTPRLADGRAVLTLHLLSPAHRPVQVTRDLASFWRTAYYQVRKDLRGRYPKHYWPDDPLAAPPTRRARPPS